MDMKRLWIFLLLSNLGVAQAWSYSCDTDSKWPPSTPTDRFNDNGDGTLTDIRLGMTWMRCSLGQTWSDNTCSGEARTYDWKGAHAAAADLNMNGGYGKFNDWRVPQIPELAMVIETQCSAPRINATLFPETPAAFYWSGTPGQRARTGAYMLSFGSEGALPGELADLHYVRLVRSDKMPGRPSPPGKK